MSTLLEQQGLVNLSADQIDKSFNPKNQCVTVGELLNPFTAVTLTADQGNRNLNIIMKTHAEACEHLIFNGGSVNAYNAMMSDKMAIRCAAALGLNAESIDGIVAKFKLALPVKTRSPVMYYMDSAPMLGEWVVLWSSDSNTNAPLYCEVCQYCFIKGWIDDNGARFAGGRVKPCGWSALPEITL